MSTLTIQPIEYKGKRLGEVGDRILSAFHPVIDDFTIAEEIGLEGLVKIEKDSGRKFLDKTDLFPPYPIAIHVINLFFVKRFLTKKYWKPILIVTQLPIYFDTLFYELLYGKGHDGIAFVSTYRSEIGEEDSYKHIGGLTTQTLHELGHGFGLEHHTKETTQDKFCPMKQLELVKVKSGELTPEKYITSLDYLFCSDCSEALINQKSLLKSFTNYLKQLAQIQL